MKLSNHQLKWLSAILGMAAFICAIFKFQSPHPCPEPRYDEFRRHSEISTSSSSTVAAAPVGKNLVRADKIDPLPADIRRRSDATIARSRRSSPTDQERSSVNGSSKSSGRLSKPPALDSGIFRAPLFFLLDDEQITSAIPALNAKAIQKLREDFVEEAGVDLLTPDDPAYAERWRKAELSLEKKMRLWYGWNAWSAFEHQAALQATAAAK